MNKKFLVIITFLFSFFSVFTANADEKKVKIASDSTNAPFEFQDSDKKYVGIDIDLINKVAEMNNWDIELTNPGYDAAINSLLAGQVDGVIAGMSITDDRKKTFDFSDQYYKSEIVIATTKEKPIKSYEELKGKTVGVKNSTISQDFILKHEKEYGYKVKTFNEASQMLDSLKIGDVDAVMDEKPVLAYTATQGKDIAINMDAEPIGGYGFAVKKGTHPELIKQFNDSLAELKASGEYDEIVAKYIGKSDNKDSAKETKKATPVKNQYNISSDSLFAPFEFQDSSKKYVGIDVDLMNAISQDQGFNVKMNFVGFQTAVDQTLANQADGMIAGMSITDERKKVFDFSEPYFTANSTIAVKEGNDKVKSYEDLKGLTVGVKNGTASQDFLEKNKDKYGYKIKVFDTADTMYESLNTSSIDAFMDDEPVVKYAIKQGRKFSTPIKPEKIGEYGFAVKKGTNPELIEMFNNGLSELKSNGQYDKILDKYVGDNQTSNKGADESTVIGILKNNWQQLLKGLGVTILLAVVSFILALIIGIIFGLFSVSPSGFLRKITELYVDLIRGVPLMVLAIFIFYGIPNLLEMLTGHASPLNDFVAGVIALTLNSSAYVAEIVRSGVQAVPVGQMEASRSLGVPYARTMRKVILPQAVKITIPSLVNQFIITLKDTTIISAIGLVELLQAGKIIVARNFQSFKVYGIVGLIYLIVIYILIRYARRLERNMK
ncbi:amino acid ABC transporter permease [Floricoccus tropicus]|uniref:Amino acid ABC transporter permease n=1 Tax=Floricoccus tropicus TaxID=1859473 RepID=A0A1E8GQC4_9LACT|nr:ABC transporter substrate-binding protein/permease [Floricoccus tropicus]OFI50451.1 amino acid ABC transporter permease [Floricoccus tropicus]